MGCARWTEAAEGSSIKWRRGLLLTLRPGHFEQQTGLRLGSSMPEWEVTRSSCARCQLPKSPLRVAGRPVLRASAGART
jgi:hypothetical protein